MEKVVQVSKLKEQKITRPVVHCEEKPLDKVFQFKYLGSIFSANGDADHDINARIAMALKRWSSLRHIFSSPHLSTNIKLRLYSASVCSLIAFDSESWQFTDKVMRRINVVNSRMLASFTQKPIQQEARPLTTSLNLVLRLRRTRLCWLGQILRKGPSHITLFQAIVAQYKSKTEGSLLMDVPNHNDFEDLVSIAGNIFQWNQSTIRKIKIK